MLAVLAAVVACGRSEELDARDDAAKRMEFSAAEVVEDLPPVSFLLARRVNDYEVWKTGFEAEADARRDATCLGHYLKRGLDDPNMVYVYCLATDVEQLRTYVEGYDAIELLSDDGSASGSTITLMRPLSRNLISGQALPGIIVMHFVEDYDAWRMAYDEFEDFRRQSGVVGHAVSRGFGDPNHIIFYHQAEDADHLRNFTRSVEFKNFVEQAGVVGDPDIRFIEIVGFASY